MKAVCLIFVALVAGAAANYDDTEGLLDKTVQFVKECGDKSVTLCIKERALRLSENLESSNSISVADGVTLTRNSPSVASVGRSLGEEQLSNEPNMRETQLDDMLMERAARFLGSHTMQFKVPEEAVDDMKRSLDEARKGGSKKTKKFLMPLLMLLKLKFAALIPIAMGFVALIAFKALVIGKLALVLSAVVGLKKLLSGAGSKSQSYDVVAHPHYSGSYEDHHYGRALGDAQELAYGAYL